MLRAIARSSLLLVFIAAVGCSDSGKEKGTEGGPCKDDGTCNMGLSCVSKLCVKFTTPDLPGKPPDGKVANLPPKADTPIKKDGPAIDVKKTDVPKIDAVKVDVPKIDTTIKLDSPSYACKIGVPDIHVFTGGMFGCGGAVTWPNRATLCETGYHVCSAAEWVAKRGGIAPTFDYWTNDNLKYGGSMGSCYATLTGGTACAADRPMRVCQSINPTAADKYGNTCTWTGCGLDTVSPQQYFGGCDANPTAGTLCCL